LDSYLDRQHGVQQSILQAFAEMCGLQPEEIKLGTDGCSAPNFAVSFYHAAWGWARLADPSQLPPARAAACRKITEAMIAHPEMVGGPERFDTAIMQVGQGRIVVKAGAEGYQGVALLPGALGPGSPALGIALKISDGDGRSRARPVVTIEVLKQLGALSEKDLEALAAYGPRKDIHNWRKLVVGEMRPVFQMEKP
jgi:L-asparaginase II